MVYNYTRLLTLLASRLARYSVKQTDKPDGFEGEQGTRITLHLKQDCLEYAETGRLEELLKKYSSFISFPIR